MPIMPYDNDIIGYKYVDAIHTNAKSLFIVQRIKEGSVSNGVKFTDLLPGKTAVAHISMAPYTLMAPIRNPYDIEGHTVMILNKASAQDNTLVMQQIQLTDSSKWNSSSSIIKSISKLCCCDIVDNVQAIGIDYLGETTVVIQISGNTVVVTGVSLSKDQKTILPTLAWENKEFISLSPTGPSKLVFAGITHSVYNELIVGAIFAATDPAGIKYYFKLFRIMPNVLSTMAAFSRVFAAPVSFNYTALSLMYKDGIVHWLHTVTSAHNKHDFEMLSMHNNNINFKIDPHPKGRSRHCFANGQSIVVQPDTDDILIETAVVKNGSLVKSMDLFLDQALLENINKAEIKVKKNKKYISLLSHLCSKKETVGNYKAFITKSGIAYLKQQGKIPDSWTANKVLIEIALFGDNMIAITISPEENKANKVSFLVNKTFLEKAIRYRHNIKEGCKKYFAFNLLKRLSYKKG